MLNRKSVLLSILFVSLNYSFLFAQASAVLYPSDDAYIDQGDATVAKGAAALTKKTLSIIRWSAAFRRRTVIRFDLSRFNNCNMSSAWMVLTQKYTGYTLPIDAYRINRTWSEATVTWQSPWGAGKYGGDYAATSVGTYTTNYNAGKDSIDLKSSVQNFVNGTYTNYGWLLEFQNDNVGSGEEVDYYSKEDATPANRPILRMTYTGCIPLPIKLLNLSASVCGNNRVCLNWQTATEINNNFFTIERSADLENWKTINQIKGAGNSCQILSYATVDKHPLNEISYYRLKQTDYDGQSTYSSTVAVHCRNGENAISIYPNPASDKIRMDGYTDDIRNIKVYNLLGCDVTTQTNILQTNTELTIDVARLTSGMYYIKTPASINKICKQ